MIEIKELLRRQKAGHSVRRIARETGTDRKTVRRYLGAADEQGAEAGELGDDVVLRVAEQVQTRPSPGPSPEYASLFERRAQIEAWLQQERPLKLTRIRELLARDGTVVPYWTLHRFVRAELGFGRPASTVRLEDPPPGQQAQIDFGRMGRIPDGSGKERVLWVLIVTLSHSRHMFVWPTYVQTTAAICEGLDAAWRYFGGVPHTLVMDNPTTMIVAPDPLQPKLGDTFSEYVQARGVFADPARVRRPKDKARVERQVQYVRERWFAGERFVDLDDARRSAATWCTEVAGRRVHGTTLKVPLEVYESVERATMLPAPVTAFDPPEWSDPDVGPDHHVHAARALYSVPWTHTGSVRVRVDSKIVRIYASGTLLRVHERQPPGGRATIEADLPPGKARYANRRGKIAETLAQAQAQGEHVGRLAERLLAEPLAWTRVRQVYALERMCERLGAARVNAACQSALAFDVIDVRRIERLVLSAIPPREPVTRSEARTESITTPRFARPSTHFATLTAKVMP